MSNYVKSTDFAAKDALTTGNPLKLIKGTEINDEFNNLQTAIATKADLSSPALSGNPTAPTQAIGNNSTRLANTAFVQQEISDAEAAIAITGGTITAVDITDVIITDADISGLVTPITVSDGGTGANTLLANAVLLGNGTTTLQTVAPTTDGNVLTANGTTWISNPKVTATTAQNSTSGTSIDFTGIPSWVKRIQIMFNAVSTSASSAVIVQLGDSGGFETTGYNSTGVEFASTASASSSITSGLQIENSSTAAYTRYGIFTLLNLTGNVWTSSSSFSQASGRQSISAGGKTLSDQLTQIRITTVNGTDTFDAGSINILYE
jgi:hypothetical protein